MGTQFLSYSFLICLTRFIDIQATQIKYTTPLSDEVFVGYDKLFGGHEFDLLIFTQEWPATVCKEWKHRDPSHTCTLPPKTDTWSIHGIWPTKLGQIGPAFCNRTWLFDPEKIRPIEDELNQVWVNIYGGTSLYSLWAHEWTKHGTCAAVLDRFNSELKYFSVGIDWQRQYSMDVMLKSKGIVPSNSNAYSVIDINNAVKDQLGVDPVIQCKKEDGESYLSEIRICFTKDLKHIDCDGVRKDVQGNAILTNCDTSQNIIYPHYKNTNSLYIQLYRFLFWLQWFTL